MKATELKNRLEKAIKIGIIKCNGINSLRCPAVGYELVHGRCEQELNHNLGDVCPVGDKRDCNHRLDILYTDKSEPDTLYVKYRIHPKTKEGFISDEDEQLCEVLDKLKV